MVLRWYWDVRYEVSRAADQEETPGAVGSNSPGKNSWAETVVEAGWFGNLVRLVGHGRCVLLSRYPWDRVPTTPPTKNRLHWATSSQRAVAARTSGASVLQTRLVGTRRLWWLAVLWLLMLTALAPLPARSQQVVRILPLGDSITHGVCCNQPTIPSSGYRAPLAQLLKQAEMPFEFVGSLKDGTDDLEDRDHEGHDGWSTHRLREIVEDRVTEFRPDIILLMAGTNDLAKSDDPESEPARAAESFGALLDLIADVSSEAVILVAPIPPIIFKEEYWPVVVAQYNAAIRLEVHRRNSDGRRVIWAPVTWSNDLVSDRVHPTSTGYQLLARAWADAISSARRP